MREITGWNEIEESGNKEYKPLPAGGYVAYITKVEDVPEKQYLRFEFDIVEGEFQGYGADCLERNGFTPLKFIRSYKDKAAGFFKGFIRCIEESNPNNFKWDWDENRLNHKYFGAVLGEEEYRKNDGSIGVRLAVVRTVTPIDIRGGRFKVPPKKTLPVTETPPAFSPVPSDSELPFDL